MGTKTTTMSLRVSPAFKQMLEHAAKHEQRSRTNFLEKLVADHCRNIGLAVPTAEEHDAAQKRFLAEKD